MVRICYHERGEELSNSRPDLAGERRRPELARAG
jgi:hypothetical protein